MPFINASKQVLRLAKMLKRYFHALAKNFFSKLKRKIMILLQEIITEMAKLEIKKKDRKKGMKRVDKN
jgi:hypothetical protein